MENLDQDTWRKELATHDNAVILDVRTPGECAEGIIPGAVQMDILNSAAFIKNVETLDKTRPHFVYCRSGGRSGQACMIMDSKGFELTRNLLGGMSEWDGEIAK